MAKFGQQVKSQTSSSSGTRTQRLVQRDVQQREQVSQNQQLSEAQERLSKAETVEEYDEIYANLNTFQKSSFKSPSQFRSELQEQRTTTISRIDQELAESREKQQQQITRMGASNRTEREERSADAKVQFYEGKIQGLEQAKRRLQGGENIEFGEALDYANSLGDSRESRRTEKLQLGKTNPKFSNVKVLGSSGEFTGVVRESKVSAEGAEELTGARFFLKGTPTTYDSFSKKVDVNAIEQRFAETEKIRQNEKLRQEVARAVGEGQDNQGVSTSPVPQEKPSKIRRTFQGIGDVLSGVFLKSTVGLGTRGFVSNEPTAFTESELIERRESELDKITIFGFTRGQLFRNKEPSLKEKRSGFLSINQPFNIVPTMLGGIRLSREIRESGRQTVAQRETDIKNIEFASTELGSLNEQISSLNKGVESGSVQPAVAEEQFGQIKEKRLAVFRDLSAKGVTSELSFDQEGNQNVTFNSRALSTDLAPASVKLLRNASPSDRAKLITGGLATEALEFGTAGYLTGASGLSAKIGVFITKLPKLARAGTVLVLGGATLTNIGFSAYQGSQRGQEAGLGRLGGALLGGGITTTQTVAFAGGTYLGNKVYTQNILNKIEQGGLTKPVQDTITVNGKKIKYPSQVRKGATEYTPDSETTAVVQMDKLRTKIPGTDIKIETVGKIQGKFSGQEGFSQGTTINTVTGKQAGAFAGQKTLSRALYFDKNGETAIVTFTKTPKGTRVDQFISGTKSNDFKILRQGTDGSNTVFIDFQRSVSKVGDPIFVQGGTLSDASVKSTFNRFIGKDQLFTGFADDLKPYSFGRTQQVIQISAKSPKSATYNLPKGSFKILSETDQMQTFSSIGSSRTGRVDVLKNLINQISKQEGSFSAFSKSLLSNKKGQLALPSLSSKTGSVTLPKSTFQFNTGRLGQQDSFLQVSPLLSELSPALKSAIGTNAFLGTATLVGVASATQLRSRQNINQRLFQLNLQNLVGTQVQTQTKTQTQQRQQQQQQQQLQQQLQQIQVQITPSPGFPNPRPPPVNPNIRLPDFDQFLQQVRGKASKKKQVREFAYTQDFTSKILETPAIKVSPQQAVKLAMKNYTGFEGRPPIIVTNSKNKDSKKLRRLLAQ